MSESAEQLPLRSKLRYAAEAVPFFLFMGLFRIMGLNAASALGGFIGRELFYRMGGTMKRARNNLRAAFPGMPEAEIDATIREMCDNLGRTIAEYAHFDKLSLESGRFELVGGEIIERLKKTGKGILFISGHFANWEMMLLMARQIGLDGGTVYRPVNNIYIDRWMAKRRAKYGPTELISKGAQGTRRIFTLLRAGQCIFILVDQKTNEGLPVPFFGRIAMTTPAPAALALKLGAFLLPASNERLGGSRFRMTVYEPLEFAPSGDHDQDVFDLTQKINDFIEESVRKRPSQWLWIHRRWPKAGDAPRSRRGLEAQALGGSGVGVEREGSSLS
ncbi:MAG TPA: lysophospholipid acyltransferase family protein [Rhizomicrobium sp.]|nr:lysophospholipid acyltransferase family protein [Rhizomicrobium sp.]